MPVRKQAFISIFLGTGIVLGNAFGGFFIDHRFMWLEFFSIGFFAWLFATLKCKDAGAPCTEITQRCLPHRQQLASVMK
jgi:hypothetical protein